MTRWLKQSTAADVVIGAFVDETDGKTPETALTISQADCQLTKNGGAVAQKNDATAASHLGGGHYKVPLNATDTGTLGQLRLYVNEGGALPVWADFMVVPANVWDSLFGADKLQVHADEITNNLITAAAIATGAITSAKFASGAVNAAALAADAVTEIAEGLLDTSILGHETPASVGGLLADASLNPWEQPVIGYEDDGTFGKELADFMAAGGGGGATAEEIAAEVWDTYLPAHTSADTTGEALNEAALGSNIDGAANAAFNLKKAFTGQTYNATGLTVAAATAVTNTVAANIVNIAGSATLYALFQAILGTGIKGTVVAGTNTATVISTDLPSTATGRYKDKTLVVLTGSRAMEGGKLVTAYDGATKRLTVEALTGALSVGDTFVLLG